jgi:hypothetical protein
MLWGGCTGSAGNGLEPKLNGRSGKCIAFRGGVIVKLGQKNQMWLADVSKSL